MELSKRNIFVRYYYWMITEYPNDICEFIKKGFLLLLLTIIPLSLIGRGADYTIRRIMKDTDTTRSRDDWWTGSIVATILRGMVTEIDSTQWRPVLIHVDGSAVLIAEKAQIKTIHIVSYGRTLVLFVMLIILIIVLANLVDM